MAFYIGHEDKITTVDHHQLDKMKKRYTEYNVVRSPGLRMVNTIFETPDQEKEFISMASTLVNLRYLSYISSRKQCTPSYNFLAQVTSACRHITSVSFSGVRISSATLDLFFGSLGENITLLALTFVGCNMKKVSTACLEKGIAENTHLKTITFSYNPPHGNRCANAVIRALDVNRTLENVTIEGMLPWATIDESFERILSTNTSITALRLPNNWVEAEMGVIFGNILARNSTLKVLNISGNSIFGDIFVRHPGIGSVEAFTAGIRQNSTLRELIMNGCRLGSKENDVLKAVVDASETTAIKKLDLSENACMFDSAIMTEFAERNRSVREFIAFKRSYRPLPIMITDEFKARIVLALEFNTHFDSFPNLLFYGNIPYYHGNAGDRHARNRKRRKATLTMLAFSCFVVNEEDGFVASKLPRTE